MRTKATLLTSLLYAALIIIAFRAASSVTGIAAGSMFAPMIWTAIVVACVMGVMASFEFERHDDAILSSMLAPVERGQIFLGKLLSNLVIALIASAFTLLLGLVMFPLGGIDLLPLLTITVLGTAAAVSILCLTALISSVSSLPRVLLPLAAVPLLIFTVVLPAVDCTARVMTGMEGWAGDIWLEALVALVVTAAGFLLAGPLTEAA